MTGPNEERSPAAARDAVTDPVNGRLERGTGTGLEVDVAIVGAGVSGLYTAWRLIADWRPNGTECLPTVHIFEMDERIGGRLESRRLDETTLVGNLGGMRYPRGQAIVTALIEGQFKDRLVSEPFEMNDGETLFYMRGQPPFTGDSWETAQAKGTVFGTRYDLKPADVGFNADQLFNKIVYDVLAADSGFRYPNRIKHTPVPTDPWSAYTYAVNLTLEEWDAVKPTLRYMYDGPYRGMLVNDLGFWNVIKDRVGQEGYEFLSVAGGYYSNTINWNAAEAFPAMVLDFTGGASYKTIRGGYDLLAYALAADFLDKAGALGKIWLKNRVVDIVRRSHGGYDVYLEHLDNTTNRQRWKVTAKRVVLAMPRRSLELLVECGVGAREILEPGREARESVRGEPSFKLLMGFESPWWGKARGRAAITDLPLRQCYYFTIDPHSGRGLFMASYNDMQTVDFWQALERVPTPPYNLHAAFQVFSFLQSLVAEYGAPDAMVHEALKQLRELEQTPNIPEPYIGIYRDWSKDPFGGGYHAWKPGVPVRDVMKTMRQPSRRDSVYVCGEAYSCQQGWVEGALCVAERMLHEHFGLTRPSWLDPNYYLGW